MRGLKTHLYKGGSKDRSSTNLYSIQSSDDIFGKIIEIVFKTIYKEPKDYNDLTSIIKSDWDYLIILDACRYDVFDFIIRKTGLFPEKSVKAVVSNASSTPEFIKKIILDNKEIFKEVVYISANPMIDAALGTYTRKIFGEYIPAWKIAWNEQFNTVLPEDLCYIVLKTFLKYKSKRMVIHFIQPHFPYIDSSFIDVNDLIYPDVRDWYNMGIRINMSVSHDRAPTRIQIIYKLMKIFISSGMLCSITSSRFCRYAKMNPDKIVKAYMINLLRVLPYAKKLAQILPGRIIITADHGEALGEYMHKLIPIRIWGHISRIRTRSLSLVPYLEIKNYENLNQSVKKALKEVIRTKIKSKLKYRLRQH